MTHSRTIILFALLLLATPVSDLGLAFPSPVDPNTEPNFLTARTFNLLPPSNNDSPGNPESIALGDFNRDGKTDMAVANASSPTVTVLLATVGGAFGLPIRYNAGASPIFVLAADLNGDGNLDLAVANYDNNFPGFSTLLGDGAGGFGPVTRFSLAVRPFSLSTADFNRDGKVDLVAIHQRSNNISVVLGDGTGHFSSPTTFAVGSTPISIAVGDFNGDSKADLAVANFDSNNVSILLGDGLGGFGIPLTIIVGVHPDSVLIQDLNSDGKADLVVANEDSNNVSVFMGTGTGSFIAPLSFATNLQPSLVTSGDFNGDGRLDLAVANYGSHDVSILLGNGNGGFGSANNFLVGPFPESLAVDDFNGDGRPDLAVLSSYVSDVWILPGKGDGSFVTAPRFDVTGLQPIAVVVSDFNGDGKSDVATANLNSNDASVLLGDGNGGFRRSTNYPVGSQPRSLATGDFNRDGNQDLVVANTLSNNVSVLLGNGLGGFGPATNFSAGPGQAPSVATGDFNGDGTTDIVVASNGTTFNSDGVSVLLGDGAGNFSSPTRITSSSPTQLVKVDDLNADGKADIVAVASSRISIILGNPTGNFVVSAVYTLQSQGPASYTISSLVLADFNGDGKTDLVASGPVNLSVLMGDGQRGFHPSTNYDRDGDVAVVRDFNGDGKADIATIDWVVSIINGNGIGGLGGRTDFGAGPGPISLADGDFDGDGKPDLVAANGGTNEVIVLLNTTGSPGPASLQFSSGNYTSGEGDGGAFVTVTRTGDTSNQVSVNYSVEDSSAQQRSDYTFSGGTLLFASGEISKTFTVPIVDDAYVEGNETVNLSLGTLVGNVVLGGPRTAVLTIVDNDSVNPGTNPNDDAQSFVRQHYLDFLSRIPDAGGLGYWTSQITQCGSDQTCVRNRRIDVSNAFFYELEYQQTGSYVYRLYRAAYGNNQPFPNTNPDPNNPGEEKKVMAYQSFAQDRARVVGGSSLAQSQLDLANVFVQRQEFQAKYPANLDGPGFVDAVLATIKNDSGADLMSQRTTLINLYNIGGRGAVIYRLADDNVQTNPINNRAFIDVEYNRAFVAIQYFGYLRREPDMGGFLFWLRQVNSAPIRDVSKQHAMVCSFITSAEYQQRFSSVISHTNAECPR